MDNKEILERTKVDEVKFISLQFTDVTGAVKSTDIPVSRLKTSLENGVWFDGSSVEGFARIQESDMRLILDPDTYAVLPWTQAEYRRARIFCDIYQPDGNPFPGDPRGALEAHARSHQATRLDVEYWPGAGIFPVQPEWGATRAPGTA